MGLFTRDIKNFNDLFVNQLRDIYYAEKQITQALPKMIEKTKSPELSAAFRSHLDETQGHVRRLDQIFQSIGVEAGGVDCPAIDGIIEEANEVAGEVADSSVMDAALLASAQAVEHYEMSRYGTLISWAAELGRSDCVSLLQQTLDEEKKTDSKLTDIAQQSVNRRAA